MSAESLFNGYPAAPGIAIGPALLHRLRTTLPERQRRHLALTVEPVSAAAASAEVGRLDGAMDTAERAMGDAENELHSMGKPAAAHVFAAHRMLLRDRSLYDRAVSLIGECGLRAEEAIIEAGEEQAEQFAGLDNPYLQARAADIREVVGQVQRILVGDTNLEHRLTYPAIIVAHDLGPYEVMCLPREYLLGFALVAGGSTAHSTILARALGVPAVTGLGPVLLDQLVDNMLLSVDGELGQVVVSPTSETLARLQVQIEAQQVRQAELHDQRHLASITRDGQTITLLTNVSSPAQAATAYELGAQGIGSLRTELLFIECATLPDEDEQIALYNAVVAEMPGLPVVIRTLDLGGDKQLPTFPLPQEDNPFLGWRGIRIGLSRIEELLLPQLRAMLRAGATADIRIVVPMITTLTEFRRVRTLLEHAHHQLRQHGVPCSIRPQLGVLIEVPAAALIADELAREADFISIGSNDLVQYTLACDRTSPYVASLYQPLEPAILRLMASVIDAAHRYGRSVSLCGEAASDPHMTALFIGLGVDELSCAPAMLPKIRATVRAIDAAAARHMAQAALSATTLDEVRELLALVTS